MFKQERQFQNWCIKNNIKTKTVVILLLVLVLLGSSLGTIPQVWADCVSHANGVSYFPFVLFTFTFHLWTYPSLSTSHAAISPLVIYNHLIFGVPFICLPSVFNVSNYFIFLPSLSVSEPSNFSTNKRISQTTFYITIHF